MVVGHHRSRGGLRQGKSAPRAANSHALAARFNCDANPNTRTRRGSPCRRVPAQSLMTATASPCVKPHGKFCRRPARSAGEITPPWAPIVRLPALDHAVIVMGRNVEMHEVYSSVCSFRGEGEDQGRIRITVVKFGRAPGLDHEPLRDDLEERTGERAVKAWNGAPGSALIATGAP